MTGMTHEESQWRKGLPNQKERDGNGYPKLPHFTHHVHFVSTIEHVLHKYTEQIELVTEIGKHELYVYL